MELVFAGEYTAPAGDAVNLNFDPQPPGQHSAAIAAVLDDVAVAIAAVRSAPININAVLDDVAVVITTGTYHEAAIAAVLDDVAAAIATVPSAPIRLHAVLDDVAVDVSADWQAGVFRGITTARAAPFAVRQAHVNRQLTGGLRQAGHRRPIVRAAWQPAAAVPAEHAGGWSDVPRKHKPIADGWDFVPARHHESGSSYSASPRQALARRIDWQIADALSRAVRDGYTSPPRHALQPVFDYTEGRPVAGAWLSGYGLATVTHRSRFTVPWQTANPHSWIWGGWHYPPPPPVPPYTPSPNLTFYQLMEDFIGGAILEFNRPCWAWPLDSRRGTINKGVIIMLHTVNVTRLPDLVNVPALSATLQFDSDSWAWGVALNLKGPQAMALLEPVDGEPRQVRVEVDGIYVTVLIEEWGERRQYGETAWTASGRSPLALLAQPFAPIRSYLQTAQQTAAQLIDHELLNTGWSASYHADLLQLFTTDWLVPDGAWSYQNKAPVDAIVQIAKAAGARAFADRNAGLVHITPRYPVSPWNWAAATPDKVIPRGVVRAASTQLAPKPGYNQVYVSGQSQGVIVSVTRQGTAGDKPAPMITDSLITYVNAGRERARNVLADTGRQARVTLDLPLNDITGLLEPGQLVEVADATPWRGLVTGITVNAAHGVISQQVEIERHYA